MTRDGYVPRPRRARDAARDVDRENVRRELERILARTDEVASTRPDDFTDGSSAYDIASMAVIRLAALLERSDVESFTARLSDDEISAIRATRNIAAHAGYPGMNDELFWTAVTVRIPEIVRRMLAP